ncbi:flagellar basal body rod protein FlgB [Halioxenophilus aromaticivorans]|uniref:Flagellar basal body rod protein FlgB n=1 Tax=Halioxenophilus aromaticivorans TaxID=1306992 RepID=A0AAV3TZK7_9ALTE
MAINFETALGVHPTALKARTERASLLANNLANAETPGFKARDMDFQRVFEQSQFDGPQGLNMNVTSQKHTPGGAEVVDNGELMYRTPTQPSIDGNTVEEHVEHAQYMENALAFEASFLFLKSKFSGLLSAIRGE